MDFISEELLQESDADYPKGLKDAAIKSDLYKIGNYKFTDSNVLVGVIGCRKPSVYGQVVTQRIVTELVYQGCTVVSGFMYGIDMEAHNASVDNGGRTVCVLGYGFKHLYNSVPEYVIERICLSGAFLTEYEHNISPKKWTFVNRNKIIAGLCSLLIVIEAEQKSGSFITCHWATKFGRSVYSVPGSILSNKSDGTNMLIRENRAKILTSVEDIANLVGNSTVLGNFSKLQNDNAICRGILEFITHNPVTFDEIFIYLEKEYDLNFNQAISEISKLELSKQIRKRGGIYYVY